MPDLQGSRFGAGLGAAYCGSCLQSAGVTLFASGVPFGKRRSGSVGGRMSSWASGMRTQSHTKAVLVKGLQRETFAHLAHRSASSDEPCCAWRNTTEGRTRTQSGFSPGYQCRNCDTYTPGVSSRLFANPAAARVVAGAPCSELVVAGVGLHIGPTGPKPARKMLARGVSAHRRLHNPVHSSDYSVQLQRDAPWALARERSTQ